jgi:hypothetical protein
MKKKINRMKRDVVQSVIQSEMKAATELAEFFIVNRNEQFLKAIEYRFYICLNFYKEDDVALNLVR